MFASCARRHLDLDDDVLQAARALSRRRGKPIGVVISELIRRGPRAVATRGGPMHSPVSRRPRRPCCHCLDRRVIGKVLSTARDHPDPDITRYPLPPCNSPLGGTADRSIQRDAMSALPQPTGPDEPKGPSPLDAIVRGPSSASGQVSGEAAQPGQPGTSAKGPVGPAVAHSPPSFQHRRRRGKSVSERRRRPSIDICATPPRVRTSASARTSSTR